MVTFKLRMTSRKNVSTSNLTLIHPLESRVLFETLKKLQVISLYWFAVQQQTSTYRGQITCSIYLKFNVEERELTSSFQNPQEVP